jgi:hypothetical protein
MGATLTTATNILKEIYEPKMQDQLQNELVTSKRLEQTSEGVEHTVGGKYVVFPIHVRRNHGLGARLEMEQLPTAQNQGYASARVSLAYLYGSVRLSGQTFELAETNAQAFASVLDQEMTGLRTDVAKDMNRQVFGTSVGALGTATGAYAASTTIPMTNTQYMEVGMIVDVYDSTGVTQRATGRTVTAVNDNVSIVVDGAGIAGGASGDIVVRQGNLNRETIGLSQIVSDTGVLYNLDPAVEAKWKSQVDANGGVNRAVSESLMIRMVDNIRKQGGKTTLITTTVGVRRAYFNLLVQQRQYHNTTEFEGGFKGLAFTTDAGEVPLISDFDCQPNRMYFINEKSLKYYRANDWSFMDRDGSKWQRVIGFDAYDATLYTYRQLGCHRRNSNGVVRDITEA